MDASIIPYRTIMAVPQVEPPFAGIMFARSRSSNFKRVLRVAQKAPTYMEFTDQPDDILYAAIYPLVHEHYQNFIYLFEQVYRWKSFIVFNDKGRMVTEEVRRVNFCYQTRLYDPGRCGDKYDHPFKCEHLGLGKYGDDAWYKYGDILPNGIFVLNKDSLRCKIKERFRARFFCPAMKESDVLSLVDKLPDTINPQEDDNWEYTDWYINSDKVAGVRPSYKRPEPISISINIDFGKFFNN